MVVRRTRSLRGRRKSTISLRGRRKSTRSLRGRRKSTRSLRGRLKVKRTKRKNIGRGCGVGSSENNLVPTVSPNKESEIAKLNLTKTQIDEILKQAQEMPSLVQFCNKNKKSVNK